MSIDNPQHNRFKDAPWYPKEDTHVLVGGAGGIGSWTALLLSRAGFIPIVYDFDILEEHNLGGQLYPKKLIRKPKVEGLQEVIKDFSGQEIIIFNERVEASTPTNIYCIAAFDNLTARKLMFESWDKQFGHNPNAIFIDGRLTAEQMQIFCIRGSDSPSELKSEYLNEQLLIPEESIEEAPCTMKQTSHAAAMIAAHITGFFTNHITNVTENDNTRTIPFKWEYFIPMDLLDVQHQ